MHDKRCGILTILGAMMLSACGGGSDVKPDHSEPTPPPGAKTTLSGVIYKIDTGGAIYKTDISEPGGDKNVLKVDGKSITLIPKGMSAGTFYSATVGGDEKLIGANLSYARYGHVYFKQSDTDYIFAQGEATPLAQMPATGQLSYTGLASYANSGMDGIATGKSSFTVDFGAKKLTGMLSGFDKATAPALIPLSATLNGNGFSGTNAAGTQTQGGFYGPNAAELAGTYMNNNNTKSIFGGTFGAKK